MRADDCLPPVDLAPGAVPAAFEPPAPSGLLSRRHLLRGVGIAGTGLVVAGTLGSTTAEAAGYSQNGWPGITSSGDSRLNRGFSAAGVAFPGGVRRGDVTTILRWVATQVNHRVERLHAGWCWGWNYRVIRGATTLSNHASATAIDINAPRHPLGSHGTFSSGQVATIHAILRTCEGVVRWGGDYSGRKDEMHFEINRRPSDAAVARVARKLGGSSTPPPPPPPSSGWPTLKQGSTGTKVRVLQDLLRAHGYSLVVDGDFGAKTKAAVVAYQRHVGLVADGIVGPKTWPKTIVTVRNGSRGAKARAAQRALNAHGFHLVLDGIFGAKSEAAAKAFQRASKITADGIVGKVTWNRLV